MTGSFRTRAESGKKPILAFLRWSSQAVQSALSLFAAQRQATRVVAFTLVLVSAASASELCGLPTQSMPQDTQPQYLDQPHWRERVTQLDSELAAARTQKVELLFLGDSIVEDWYPAVFQLFYGHRAALNLGIRGENTQGILWQLARIPFTALRPHLIVLLIGTNNLWAGKRAEDVALGIAEVANQIRQRSPETRILLLGLLPRGPGPTDPLRQLQARVNTLIAHCADGVSIFYADPGALLLDAQGRLSDQISQDYLHPTWVGYGILSAALEPSIRSLLAK
jgi:lysophospholipase L1-like esterase